MRTNKRIEKKEEGRGKKEEVRGKREEGRGKKEEGRGKREEGRGKKEEGRGKREEERGKREEGRGKKEMRRGTRNAERRTPNPKRRTPNPERRTPNAEPRTNDEGLIRLNKYISNAGICSRREADKLIQAGVVKVNGVVVTELGTKISRTDKVQYGEQTLSTEKLRYLLLNKPKGYITTTDDPQERKTVMLLIANACRERIYPVGRLDRNTTGLLLFTNDGEIAKKLSHPRYGIKKIYHVVLDQGLSKAHKDQIARGIELEDGIVKVDAIEYIGEGSNKTEIGVELHSGKNRVVRRIFEQLEYKVTRLDRVYFAGLTKKNLPRGHWRFLEEHEINMLKMIS